jgi:hypothetical protein
LSELGLYAPKKDLYFINVQSVASKLKAKKTIIVICSVTSVAAIHLYPYIINIKINKA